MKIFDCFTFNDENELLEIRLNELNKYVDFFVIIEFGETHQGTKKSKNIDKRIINKFRDKIRYFFFDRFDENLGAWQKESFQRNKILEGIKDSENEDIIIVSDVDEIPNLHNFNFFNIEDYVYAFSQTHTMYKFNIVRKKKWIGTKLCKKKILKSPQWLRSVKVHKKYNFYRIDKIFSKTYYKKFKIIKNGGWHFGWLKTPSEIIKKINSYAHEEHNNLLNNNLDYITRCINNNLSFLDNKDELLFEKKLNFLPLYINQNLIKYSKWIKRI